MTRLVPCLAAALPVLLLAQPALAGDLSSSGFSNGYQNFFGNTDDLRSGFSEEFDNSNAYDPLSFELGTRYWYSWGSQKFTVGPFGSLNESDNSSSAEAYARVDDHSTGFYAKGLAGASFSINGTSNNNSLGEFNSPVTDGHIGYAGADIGWSWWGDPRTGSSFGPFAGYMYWNDSPNIGRANFVTGTQDSDFAGGALSGPGNSEEDNINVNALRLGLSGKANFGNGFGLSGELAAVPYAQMGGTLGAFGVPTIFTGAGFNQQASAADISGWGYGAMGEVMATFTPMPNLSFGLGGRAWYLQGQADSSFNTITVSTDDPPKVLGEQRYITTANPWSLFRYGLLAQANYNF